MRKIHKQRLCALLRKTVSINTCNPPGNERALAVFLKQYLGRYRLRSQIIEYKKGRSNILCRLPSENARRVLICSPHLDTVPALPAMLQPLLKGGKVFGRGTTDCKGNLCAVIEAMITVRKSKALKNLDVVLCATADEEAGSKEGLRLLLQQKKVAGDFWLILDSDDFEVITAQKGLMHLRATIQGASAHASVPYKGRSAIADAGRVIQRLQQHKFQFKKHPLLLSPTVNIGTIRGGDKINMVASSCVMEIDIRYLPSMKEAAIIDAVRAILKKETRAFTLDVLDLQKPVEHPASSVYVDCLKNTLAAQHIPVRVCGSEGATVMSILNDSGERGISFGFGAKHMAHSDTEYVKLNDLYRGAQVLVDYFLMLDGMLDE